MAEDEQFIVEFVQIGRQVRATAFDPVTLAEASVIGPSNVSRSQLAELAARKLRYVLGKKKNS